MSGSGDEKFLDRVLKGNVHKDIVRVMLQKSGYTIYNYGYESPSADVKSKLTKNTRNSKTVRRIRSSPDLLVYDDQKDDLMLVEVKMRKDPSPKIRPRLTRRLKEFWNDSILVLVVPQDNVFYAQKIAELETKPVYYPSQTSRSSKMSSHELGQKTSHITGKLLCKLRSSTAILKPRLV